MARIRKVEIESFRSIKSLEWFPSPGINCLIGPGDSGKTTILDAIDYCLGARRNLTISDADFFEMDVSNPIRIALTIGQLSDALKNIDTYGQYLRGYFADSGVIEDEPEKGAETVLCLQLTVQDDLEPKWELLSDRAAKQGLSRSISWGDRQNLAPNRMGALTEFNLGWRKGSVLNRLTDEPADASAALIEAARVARESFGKDAQNQLADALKIVETTAAELGVAAGAGVQALLDAHSVSFSGGTVSLHDAKGVPLRNLGVGSMRLLIAGLQRAAAEKASLVLIDELEHGLEPHRIIRLLGSLGAKESLPPLQVFLTTHSPTALTELNGNQLFVLRRDDAGDHKAIAVGSDGGVQGTIRRHPEAFLSRRVVVCEGASEVGLLRGLDQFFSDDGKVSALPALGVALTDGGGVSKVIGRGSALLAAGYPVAVFRDDDRQPDATEEEAFLAAGGELFKWRPDWALEDALFSGLPTGAVEELVNYASELHEEGMVDQWIKSASQNQLDLKAVQMNALVGELDGGTRGTLAQAARQKLNPWFKNITAMEHIGRHIVGPHLAASTDELKKVLESIFEWARRA